MIRFKMKGHRDAAVAHVSRQISRPADTTRDQTTSVSLEDAFAQMSGEAIERFEREHHGLVCAPIE